MDWYTRRRLLYALATVITFTAVTLYFLHDTIFPPPTCFDTKQNGYESEVDCGGVCDLTCKEDVSSLSVQWAQAIKVSQGTYDLVGMVSNKNIDNASYYILYTFSIYNSQGEIFETIHGTTTAPVDGDFPIINQYVSLKQSPYRVTMQLADGEHYKVHEKPTSPTLRITNEHYENVQDVSRVYATVKNTKRINISNLPVKAILYDEKGNVYAVGATVVPSLSKEEVKDITFTWDSPLTVPPTRIRIYPIFDPFVAIE